MPEDDKKDQGSKDQDKKTKNKNKSKLNQEEKEVKESIEENKNKFEQTEETTSPEKDKASSEAETKDNSSEETSAESSENVAEGKTSDSKTIEDDEQVSPIDEPNTGKAPEEEHVKTEAEKKADEILEDVEKLTQAEPEEEGIAEPKQEETKEKDKNKSEKEDSKKQEENEESKPNTFLDKEDSKDESDIEDSDDSTDDDGNDDEVEVIEEIVEVVEEVEDEPKKKSKKKFIILGAIAIFIILMLLLAILAVVGGLGGFLLFKSTAKDDTTPSTPLTQENTFTCDKPYILHGDNCCLDMNDNEICDNDEQMQKTTTTTKKTTTTQDPNIILDIDPPETTTTTTISLGVCGKDEDCGLRQYRCGSYFCKDGSVYRTCKTDLCINPGKNNAACTTGNKDLLIDECLITEICVDGHRSCEIQSNTCTYPEKIAPTDAEILEISSNWSEKIQGFSFRERVRANDDRGCVGKIYLYLQKPNGLQVPTEMTWEKNGQFQSDEITTGLLEIKDEETSIIWVDLPCTTKGVLPLGAQTYPLNAKEYLTHGRYKLRLNQVLYDSAACPERIKIETQKDDSSYVTLIPGWSQKSNLDTLEVGLIKITDDLNVEIWIK